MPMKRETPRGDQRRRKDAHERSPEPREPNVDQPPGRGEDGATHTESGAAEEENRQMPHRGES
jgi:hypothetical protein